MPVAGSAPAAISRSSTGRSARSRLPAVQVRARDGRADREVAGQLGADRRHRVDVAAHLGDQLGRPARVVVLGVAGGGALGEPPGGGALVEALDGELVDGEDGARSQQRRRGGAATRRAARRGAARRPRPRRRTNRPARPRRAGRPPRRPRRRRRDRSPGRRSRGRAAARRAHRSRRRSRGRARADRAARRGRTRRRRAGEERSSRQPTRAPCSLCPSMSRGLQLLLLLLPPRGE